MAEPAAGGELVDPHGGSDDLAARRLRMVSGGALASDPLRTLRAVRLSAELGFDDRAGDAGGGAPARAGPRRRRRRADLRRAQARRRRPRAGRRDAAARGRRRRRRSCCRSSRRCAASGRTSSTTSTSTTTRSRSSTRSRGWSATRRRSARARRRRRPTSARPIGDGLDGWQVMRFAALLHDAAKPATRAELGDGRVSFVGHDELGAQMARDVLRRLRASERVAEHVAALTRHHLILGFLVHERPLARRTVHRYLQATEPFAIDATVFTVADRLATRGKQRRGGDRRPPRAGCRDARPRARRAAGPSRSCAATSWRASSAAGRGRGSRRCSRSSRRTATRARSRRVSRRSRGHVS